MGPNHYVVMSNASYAIYSKAGVEIVSPTPNNTLWTGFGGDCETDNAGLSMVVYDQLADRWLLGQITDSGPSYFLCIAISVAEDPAGSYFRWAISTGTNYPAAPKMGLWPDAYYISTREFAGGATFAGVGAYAFKRDDFLAGNANPSVLSFLVSDAIPGVRDYSYGDGLLPADLEGSTPPPVDSPHFFMGSRDDGGPYEPPSDGLTLWKFVVDWESPQASSFSLAATIPVAPFDSIFPCSPTSRDCIPQADTTLKVDVQSYRQRLLPRLVYRNFGTHESLVTNQAVEAAPGLAGIRWYELRDPDGSPILYQQANYAPGVGDGIHRWNGSIAMDSSGNIALGFSASDSEDVFPSVWYTGRLVSDPLDTLLQGEEAIVDGTGSQITSNRWGDFSSMGVDPVDGCTFWHVNQYIPTSGDEWRLRIGAFKFDACLPEGTIFLDGFESGDTSAWSSAVP